MPKFKMTIDGEITANHAEDACKIMKDAFYKASSLAIMPKRNIFYLHELDQRCRGTMNIVKTIEKEVMTPEQYIELVNKLIHNIKKTGFNYDCVYGIPRGGLPIAVHISHHMKIPMLTCLSHDYISRIIPTSGNILIVDDKLHTGQTINQIQRDINLMGYKHVCTATLLVHQGAPFMPTHFVSMTDKWNVFPWEPEDEEMNR